MWWRVRTQEVAARQEVASAHRKEEAVAAAYRAAGGFVLYINSTDPTAASPIALDPASTGHRPLRSVLFSARVYFLFQETTARGRVLLALPPAPWIPATFSAWAATVVNPVGLQGISLAVEEPIQADGIREFLRQPDGMESLLNSIAELGAGGVEDQHVQVVLVLDLRVAPTCTNCIVEMPFFRVVIALACELKFSG
ncbi:hypothetical protein E2562_033049 [Oryza meyeriana var. granulata]|uniref:Uncharacterized protein n=1 Tax=Oryza meyeriana var. granulata TaxID=110450 RepID=A0A6G1CLU9_9ORYZ|nr:hypothetical protein E2562_033049 [Oryza meyeriana var. granulata]